MTTPKSPRSPKPVLTGWCNRTAEPWSHARCQGQNAGHPCPCDCHRTETVDPDGWDHLDQILDDDPEPDPVIPEAAITAAADAIGRANVEHRGLPDGAVYRLIAADCLEAAHPHLFPPPAASWTVVRRTWTSRADGEPHESGPSEFPPGWHREWARHHHDDVSDVRVFQGTATVTEWRELSE